MVDTPEKTVAIAKFDPVVGTIVKFPPPSGELVNWFKLNPQVGDVCAVPTVLNPARVLSCQNFNTPVTGS